MSQAKERPRPAQLAVPGDSETQDRRLRALQVDLVFLDIEDAVAPAGKATAREHVIHGLSTLDWGKTIHCVRVNNNHSHWFIGDLTELVGSAGVHIDTLVIQKLTHADEIRFTDRLLGMLEADAGLTRRVGLALIVENASGSMNLESICAASDRLEAAVLGVGD